MLPAILERTTLVDIHKLVATGVPESIRLDYKRDNYRINNTNADDKKKQCKELLKDTSAFANSEGGDLIIGVDEPKGTSGSVVGIETADPDNLKRQMTAIIRNGTDPKFAFTIHTIESAADRHIYIIRIPRSIYGPHKASYQGEPGTYWCRDSGGAHEMTPQEVADLARRSTSLMQQIEDFRKIRVDAIQRNDCPVNLSTSQRMVFHFIPEVAFSDFEITQPSLTYFTQLMPILRDVDSSHEHNSDGVVTFDRNTKPAPSAYVQLYRNGIIEAVADDVTRFHPDDAKRQTRWFRHSLIPAVPSRIKNYFELYGQLQVPPPVWFFMSFIGLDGSRVWCNDVLSSAGKPIKEKILITPGQEIQAFGVEIKSLIKPGFDKLWNAAGYPNCTALDW